MVIALIGAGWAYPWKAGSEPLKSGPAAGVAADPSAGLESTVVPGPSGAVVEASPVGGVAQASPSKVATAASSVRPSSAPGVAAKVNASGANLALRGTVTASAAEGDGWAARYACDGDPATRWSSGFADPQWLRVDLGRRWQVSEVTLIWERAYGVSYRVETSLDGRTWRKLWSTRAGKGGTVRIDAKRQPARYVRMYGTERNSAYGYSLLEFQVR